MKNLNAEDFASLLASDRLDACNQAREWAEGKSLDEVWKTCHRGDWMLWLAARYGDVPLKTIVAIACDAVEPTLAFTTDPLPTQTIAVVRRWLKDEATIEEVRAASDAANAAANAAAKAAADAAAYAANAAAYAANAAADAAADAANAAADAAADAADYAAYAAKAADYAAKAAKAAKAADYAAYAAKAADYAAARAAAADARAASLLFSADICRKYIEIDEV